VRVFRVSGDGPLIGVFGVSVALSGRSGPRVALEPHTGDVSGSVARVRDRGARWWFPPFRRLNVVTAPVVETRVVADVWT
jgi:hypothetical protein